MFGLTISILFISIGTSFIVQLQEINTIKGEAMPEKALEVQYQVNNATFNTHLNILKNLSEGSGAIISNNDVYLDRLKMSKAFSAIFFNGVTEWSYPFYDGRYFTKADMDLGSKVVLIGKKLHQYTEQENNKTFLTIEGMKYEVIGTIGMKGRETSWDNTLIMPLTSIPESTKSKIEKSSIEMILYNDQVLPINDFKLIKESIMNYDHNALVEVGEFQSGSPNILLKLITQKDTLVIFSILLYIVALINSLNISSLWITNRTYEIGVRKAFGHSNRNIAVMLFLEMMTIISFCSLIALLIQIIIGKISSLISYPLTIDNGITAVCFTLITSIAASIIPIIKSLKIQPIETINN
jgi:ABC-type transport system, involved in lipoprotein release, permease component